MENVILYLLNTMFGMVIMYGLRKISGIRRENAAVRAGLQALLRDNMIRSFNHYYNDKQYIPIYAKDSFLACYDSYHNLGKNGVMNDIRDKIVGLRTEPPGGSGI